MNHYDFNRSFLKWTSTGVNHSPRLRVEAVCRLMRAGKTTEFFLGALCVGETMYADKDLIQMPAYEFAMICAPGDQFMFVKLHADEALNVVEQHRVGEVMSTHDGKGSAVTEMSVQMAYLEKARELTAYGEIREAILGNKALNARTEYLGEDGQTQVVMDYPVKVCNVAHDKERWQVDAGLVLIPDMGTSSVLLVGKMRIGYIVFNDWNWAEVVIRTPKGQAGGAPESHYSPGRRLRVRNHIFCAD